MKMTAFKIIVTSLGSLGITNKNMVLVASETPEMAKKFAYDKHRELFPNAKIINVECEIFTEPMPPK